MEEKERFELFGEHCIKDNNPDARCQLLDTYKACVILNEQDKQIKELEEENKELKDYTENTANLIDKLTEDSVFASTQLAIEKLKKIKEEFTSEKWDLYDTPDLLEQVCELRNNQIKYIDNQIKELGGEKNE